METYYYKNRSDTNLSNYYKNLLTFTPPKEHDIKDYFIEYLKESVGKLDPHSFLFFFIVVIIIYIMAVSIILLVIFSPKKSSLSVWLEKYVPFVMKEGYAIILLFLATILTSFIDGYSLIIFFLTSIIFIAISLHKSKCNNLIRWPLLIAGVLLMFYSIISAFGKLFNWLNIIIGLFKYTTILSFIFILMDYKIFIEKKCLTNN